MATFCSEMEKKPDNENHLINGETSLEQPVHKNSKELQNCLKNNSEEIHEDEVDKDAAHSDSSSEKSKEACKHSNNEMKKSSKKKSNKDIEDSGKEGNRAKNKEDKSIDQILKSLNNLPTPEEKLSALCKKYSELLESHKIQQNKQKQFERSQVMLQREKEQLQNDNSKAILAKSKLESLCRELQRQNKLIKDESMQRAREQEEKRKEVTGKFQTTLNEITAQMQENYQRNTKLKEENIELGQKLKGLVEQYEVREQHVEKIIKHKELETQLAEARLAQASLLMAEEKEKFLKEKEKLLIEATQYQKKCEQLECSEASLRTQLSLYIDKYDDFQKTLNKSNEVFASFKGEMEKMTKKIKKLEKETSMWRTRWENCNKTLLEMVEEKASREKETATLQTKLIRLEKLCRALQSERIALTNKYKNEIESGHSESKPVVANKEMENVSTERESSTEKIDVSRSNFNITLQNSLPSSSLTEDNSEKFSLSSELSQAESEVEKLKAVVQATKEILASTSHLQSSSKIVSHNTEPNCNSSVNEPFDHIQENSNHEINPSIESHSMNQQPNSPLSTLKHSISQKMKELHNHTIDLNMLKPLEALSKSLESPDCEKSFSLFETPEHQEIFKASEESPLEESLSSVQCTLPSEVTSDNSQHEKPSDPSDSRMLFQIVEKTGNLQESNTSVPDSGEADSKTTPSKQHLTSLSFELEQNKN